eukprot:4019374-Pyramimonas_sp.AAC.1
MRTASAELLGGVGHGWERGEDVVREEVDRPPPRDVANLTARHIITPQDCGDPPLHLRAIRRVRVAHLHVHVAH